MHKDLKSRPGGWVDRYRILINKKGISHKYAEWYMRRAVEFMRYTGCTDPRGLTREQTERYLAEKGRQNSLESWQFRQVVDAIRLLADGLAGLEWAKEVDWPFWRGSVKEVDGEHRTLYRESHAAKVDFSKYNLQEHGPAPEGLAETLERVRNMVRRRNYSTSTEKTYLLWCTKFLRFHSAGSPQGLAEESIKAYMAYLALRNWTPSATASQPSRFSFLAGTIVHPLSPKTWMMATLALSSFADGFDSPGERLLVVPLSFLIAQVFFHSLWCLAGAALSRVFQQSLVLHRALIVLTLGVILWAVLR